MRARAVLGAAGEAAAAFAGLLGFGGEPSTGPEHRRGALHVAVQVLTAGVLCALLFGLRHLVRGVALLTPGLPLLVAAAFALSVPLLIHWFARSERRVGGALAAFATVVANAAAVHLLVGWPTIEPFVGLAALVTAFATAGAVFGAVAPTR